MMFCRNCGKEIPNGINFCNYCGAAQNNCKNLYRSEFLFRNFCKTSFISSLSYFLWHPELTLPRLPVLYKYHTSINFTIVCAYFIPFVHKSTSFVYTFIPPGILPVQPKSPIFLWKSFSFFCIMKEKCF